MLTSLRRPHLLVSFSIAAALSQSACEGPAVLTDLANELVPEPDEGYERGGTRIADGRYRDLGVASAPPTFDFALALDEDSNLIIASIATGDRCQISNVMGYQSTVWDSFDFEDARIPFLRSTDAGTVLQFSDFGCNESELSLPDSRVIDFVPLPNGGGVIVQSEGDRILAVNPFTGGSRSLGRRVLPENHPFALNLLVNPVSGALIFYDNIAQPIVEVGAGVVDASLLPDGGRLLWAEADGALYEADLSGATLAFKQLAQDGCSPIGTGRLGGYLSPCEQRRLVLYDPAIDEKFVLADGVFEPRIVSRSIELEFGVEAEALSAVFFRDFDSETASGSLWAQQAEGVPYELADEVSNGWMLPLFVPRKDANAVAALVLARQEDGAMTLVASDGGNRVSLAEHVLAIAESHGALLLIAEGDQQRGDLLLLESRPPALGVFRDPELVLSNALAGLPIAREVIVPEVFYESIPQAPYRGGTAFLLRAGQGKRGDLYLAHQSGVDGSFETELLAEGAGPTYVFSQNLPETALSLVSSRRDGAGSPYRLRQLWYGRELENTIASDVVEFRESIVEGRRGVLYATGGDDPALWFSSLK